MIIWVTGISGAGKTTIAKNLYSVVKKRTKNVIYFDGDLFREIFKNDIGYTLKDRDLNALRMTRLLKYINDSNVNVICGANITSQKFRNWNRKNIKNYYEVFIDVPFDILLKRDYKNLYKKAKKGIIKNVVGVDIPYIKPKNPNLIVDNSGPKKNINKIVDLIIQKSKIFKKLKIH